MVTLDYISMKNGRIGNYYGIMEDILRQRIGAGPWKMSQSLRLFVFTVRKTLSMILSVTVF